MGAIRRDDVFGVAPGFHAKAAAHIAHQHTHMFFFQAQGVGHSVANRCGHLAAEANDQSAIFRICQYAARLNGQGRQSLVDDVQVHHMGSLVKSRLGCFGVAVTGFGHAVVWRVGKQGRMGRQCISQMGGAGQGLKINLDKFCSVFGLLLAAGHDCGDGFAHKSHGVGGQGKSSGGGQRRTVCTFEIGRLAHGL